MNLVCLDLEGVLTPEIWIEFALTKGIPELKRTTRDEPDYRKLMQWRIDILKKHQIGLKDIQTVIKNIDPLPGACEFLNKLRDRVQVLILSDTFEEFAKPLMNKLGRPTIFCNSLDISDEGEILQAQIRIHDSKRTTVLALQSIGMDVISVGDSYNDIGMLTASRSGFLFRTTDLIRSEYPELPAFTAYDELLGAITNVL